MNIEYVKKLSEQLCMDNPDALVVFGDNLIGKGKAGQACIRDMPNAYGIPTKRLPSMKENSFFSDQPSEIRIVKQKIKTLKTSDKDIIMPVHQIGSGLAQLKYRSPMIWKIITKELYKEVTK